MKRSESHPKNLTLTGWSVPSRQSEHSHMHLCGLGLKPASIIIVHWCCHYSIFPPLWLLPLSPRLRKECSNHFPFKREREREIFSEGVELEDDAVFWPTDIPVMKSNLVLWIGGKLGFLLSMILRWSLIEDCSPIWHGISKGFNPACYQLHHWRIILWWCKTGTGFTKNLSVQGVNAKVSEQLRSKIFHCITKLWVSNWPVKLETITVSSLMYLQMCIPVFIPVLNSPKHLRGNVLCTLPGN